MPIPPSSHVNVSPAGAKGDNAKVWQRVDEVGAFVVRNCIDESVASSNPSSI